MEMNRDTKRLIVNGMNPIYPLRIEQFEKGVAFEVGNIMTGSTGMVVKQEDLPLIIDFLKWLNKEYQEVAGDEPK